MTSKSNHLPKVPSPNTVTLRGGASICEFWWGWDIIQSIAGGKHLVTFGVWPVSNDVFKRISDKLGHAEKRNQNSKRSLNHIRKKSISHKGTTGDLY